MHLHLHIYVCAHIHVHVLVHVHLHTILHDLIYFNLDFSTAHNCQSNAYLPLSQRKQKIKSLIKFHYLILGPISHRKNLRPSPSSSSASTLTIPIEKQLMSPRGSVITPLVVLPRASHQPKQQSQFGQRKVQDNGDTFYFY
jgi:hypothetical protein